MHVVLLCTLNSTDNCGCVNWIGNCLIHLAIVNHADYRFKFVELHWKGKAIGSRSENYVCLLVIM